MSTISKAQRTNFRIAQFMYRLDKLPITIVQNCIEDFFDKIEYINEKVTATNFLQLFHPEWIGCTILHIAASYRDTVIFLFLLNKGADFTIQNNDGDTALHLAFKENPFKDDKNKSDLITHLENSKIGNICNKYGFSHFHIACILNSVKLVKQFLAYGVPVDQAVVSESPFCPGYTPLHFAVNNCAFEVAEVLLLHGANIHAKDSKHMTPLHVLLEENFHVSNSTRDAVLKSSDQTMKEKIQKLLGLILKFYADTEMIIIDDVGISNLHVACTLGDLTAAESILNKVTNINHCINVNSHLWQGYTALHFAALSNVEAVKLLMRNGADIDFKDAKGVTAFDLCIKKLGGEDIHAIISLNPIWRDIVLSDGQSKLLDLVLAMRTPDELDIFLKEISRGKDVDIKVHIPNDSPLWPGFSMMHLAIVLSGNTLDENAQETSFQLLTAIFNQNSTMLYHQDVHRWSPLHLAYRLCKHNIVHLLLECHICNNNSPNLVDEDDLSYMHIACAQKDVDFLKKLLENNSNVNPVYRGKSVISKIILPLSTPLHVAVATSSIKMIKTLLNHRADVNAKNSNDMTPIHLLIDCLGVKEMSNILLSSSNLKDSVVNEIGLSHLHVSAYLGDVTTTERLVADGANINQILEKNFKFKYLSKYEGFTPLSFALNELNFATAIWLMEHGADIFVRMPSGNSLFSEMIKTCASILLPRLSEADFLANHVRMEIGLTKLHLACFNRDYQSVKDLLNSGANVNAQIYKKSPSWSGFTPLHVVISHPTNYFNEDLENILELLIHKGADVTLPNSDSYTPIHMAYKIPFQGSDKRISPYINKLLEAQKDFNINPSHVIGVTHFHIACSMCNTAIVEEFLKCVNSDVNQPADEFNGLHDLAGATPLQLVVENEMNDTMERLQTAKLLLTHGADANTVNSLGYTLLHWCIRSQFIDLFEMLVRFGADVNAKDFNRQTPLECFIIKHDFSAADAKFLLRFGFPFNKYNASTEAGYIGLALQSISFKAMQDLIPAIAFNFSHLVAIDDMNRTAIHNIVAVPKFKISDDEYATLIEQLTVIGCDIDDQDNAGRSALHLAAKFHNYIAIAGLLMAGADINITDSNGKTAFPSDTACCDNDNTNYNSIYEPSQKDNKFYHFMMIETFVIHVKKLQLCGLDVHPINKNLTLAACQKFDFENDPDESFFEELEELQDLKIGLYSLTLFDFMSDDGAIVDYPSMSPTKRKAIKNTFSQTRSLREEFRETWGILQLQYRKAVARVQLVDDGRHSLTILIGFRLPEICSQIILKLLKNSDLKMLILASKKL